METVLQFLKRLAEELKEVMGENLISVVLFGSYARRQIRAESDVDVLIIADRPPSSSLERQAQFTKILQKIENPPWKDFSKTGWAPYVAALLKTPQEANRLSRIYFDMVDEAQILYDRGDFFKSILERVRERLKTLGAKKIRKGNMWYWDLKPDYKPGEVFEI